MKQTSKTSTYSLTSLRLDPLSKAKLSWCKAFYESNGESVSSSIIFRRAIEHLTDHLDQTAKPRSSKSSEIEIELMFLLSCMNNKPSPFSLVEPWDDLKGKPIKPYSSYVPNKLVELLESEHWSPGGHKSTNN